VIGLRTLLSYPLILFKRFWSRRLSQLEHFHWFYVHHNHLFDFLALQQLSYHNAHAQAHTFKVGDLVRIYKQTTEEKGIGGKLAYAWKGPYKVIEVVGPVAYRVADATGNVLAGTVHARHMNKTIV